jgi:N-acetyl-gamma-glutamyl-phosphate reductase
MQHASPAWVGKAVYGLPEHEPAAIRNARLVANPGCYPTAVQLGFMPLLERAGRTRPSRRRCQVRRFRRRAQGRGGNPFSEASDNFKAYAVPGHRHLPEIRQGLSAMAGEPVGLTFVPHLTPMIRGIHATLYARIRREADFQALFEERYRDEPFVDVLPPGSHPDTRSVRAANTCRIAVHRPQGGEGRRRCSR